MSWEATWLFARILVIASAALNADLLSDQKGWRSFVSPLSLLVAFPRPFERAAPISLHPAIAIAVLALWVLAFGARGKRSAGLRSWALLASGMTCISVEF